MSIYSGFATRQQQQKYNSLLETLMIALKKRIIKFYKQQEADEDKFKLLVKKIYKKMYLLERGKFMTPKYTSCLTDLVHYLSIDINYDTLSECSSVASNITFRKDQQDSEQHFQSFNALKFKVNQLQTREGQRREHSALSMPRKQKYARASLPNEEEEQRKGKKMAQSMYQAIQEKVERKRRFKGPMVDLKELRGTSHMPKWQDFAPKRTQIFPLSPRRGSPRNIEGRLNAQHVDRIQNTFRRQKYVKSVLKIEDI